MSAKYPAAPVSQPMLPGFVIGHSRSSQRLITDLLKLASLVQPVLLRGETGTGKELAAQLLHRYSCAASSSVLTALPSACRDQVHAQVLRTTPNSKPFVAINCASIPESLAESELFGHSKGAFTGALRNHKGAFSRANGGTLFLDEIGELPARIQAKLLRVLETGIIQPVGEELEMVVQVRLVAATHRNLEAMIVAGQFREDLYHRLAVFEVEIPPLRARRNDIASLLQHFADQCSAELGRSIRFDRGAIAAAMDYSWPGNIRSLRNAVIRAAVFGADPIRAEDLVPKSQVSNSMSCLQIPRGSYATMKQAMLSAIVAETGSIRRAAKVLEVPKSTLGSWLRDPQTH